MPPIRHHTVSAFLLDGFAGETKKGHKICMLEKASPRPLLVSPRDATVRKHFYSIDVDDGRREPAVEIALGEIENVAAPLVARVERGDPPVGNERLELALFVAMCWLRTPAWRAQMRSVMEQTAAAMIAEGYRRDPAAAQRAFADSEMTLEEIETFRTELVAGLDSGRFTLKFSKNAMIGHFLNGAQEVAWTLFMLNWSVVRLEESSPQFVIADTPVSLFDPKPMFPGGGAGPLSSPYAQMFLPLGPRVGLLLESSPELWQWARENLELHHEMSPEERGEAAVELEGTWGEGRPTTEFANDLNLRSYATAERYIFGSQKAVQDVHASRRRYRQRLAALAPQPSRLHLVEDDQSSPTGVRIVNSFSPKTEPRRRTR